MMDSQEPVVYIKTIRAIADEIGVSKQAVFKKINRQPLSTELMGLTATVDGRLMVSVDGERLIKQAFCIGSTGSDCQPSTKTVNHQPSTDNLVDGRLIASVDGERLIKQAFCIGSTGSDCQPSTKTVNHQPSTDNLVDGEVDGRLIASVDGLRSENEKEKSRKNLTESARNENSVEKDEVVFLRQQIEQMNDQLLRRDTMIESLNRELEKEREHNREKDRQLLDTLSKLAETQAVLAVGQSAEKQKALAETLIEGQQMMDGEHREQSEPIAKDFEEEFHDESKKQGLLQRIWAVITNK